jgi:hypothetical protein
MTPLCFFERGWDANLPIGKLASHPHLFSIRLRHPERSEGSVCMPRRSSETRNLKPEAILHIQIFPTFVKNLLTKCLFKRELKLWQ